MSCFTRSEYAPFGDTAFVHENDRRSYVTAMRHREDIRWSAEYRPQVGLVDLNLRDAPQRRRCGLEEVCGLEVDPADGALEKIRAALGRRKMDALVLPLGVGGHVDHLTARLAGEVGQEAGLAVAFYEDLPFAARPGAAEEIEGRVAEVARPMGELGAVFAGEACSEEEAVARKRRLALCYDSQVDSAGVEAIAGFCARYGGRERLWGNGAWRRSGLGA